MPSFMVMDPAVVRLQLPGGTAFAPALVEAAGFAARRGFSEPQANALVDLVEKSVAALNNAAPATITMTFTEHGDHVEAVLDGAGCTAPIDERKCHAARQSGSSCRSLAIGPGARPAGFTISFTIGIA